MSENAPRIARPPRRKLTASEEAPRTRGRAARMVFEVRAEGESHGSMARVAAELAIYREALRGRVRQAEIGIDTQGRRRL